MDEGVVVTSTWVVQSVHMESKASYVALQPVAWYKEDPDNPEDVVDAAPLEVGASWIGVDGGMTLVCDADADFRPGDIMRVTMQQIGHADE